jgi:N-acetylmuramoyl-L-alanine amidase
MKKIIVIMSFISTICLNASVTVQFEGSPITDNIRTEKIDKIDYFYVNELNKVFHASIRDDVIDRRLMINMYEEQIIILLDSSWLEVKGQIYNLGNSVFIKSGKTYVPVSFLQEILPTILPEKVVYNSGIIRAANPVDNSIRKIVLDPGHGGKDPGAVGYSKNNFEKEIALAVTKKLKKKLSEIPEIEVILARDKDEFISLQQRTKFANSNRADLFISIHCNAHRSNKANGIEVYYLSTAKTDDARAVEALENSVVYDYEGGEEAVREYNDLQFILQDMAQSEHLEESYDLALNLQTDLVKSTGAYDRGVKQANFYVLRGAFMPAVLIELGFMSNIEEEKKLTSESYQNKLTNSIFEGIKNFKYKYDLMQ